MANMDNDATTGIAPPAATGNAGPQFEAKVGAHYLLSLLASGEPRGLPGATVGRVQLQQAAAGYPLDDVVIRATNADGSPAVLEIQAKRTLDFTASDKEFADVPRRMWMAAQKPEFKTSRYELAVAIARTSTRIERSCQAVLYWARHLPDGATFAAHISREGFSSKEMRDFVGAFRKHLAAAGAPTNDDAVWRLLSRFQILVFDFESPGSDYEHRARERARMVLAPDQAARAADLWAVLIDQAASTAIAGGELDHAALTDRLQRTHGFQLGPRTDLRRAYNRLAEAAGQALDDIKDQIGGVRLARTELVDQCYAGLEQNRLTIIVGDGGLGKSAILKLLALRVNLEGMGIFLAPGRIIPGGWVQMASVIDCPVPLDELFNELGCGGCATLFVDNIDQIDDSREWATVVDLLRGVVANPGWRVVATARTETSDWKAKLPAGLAKAGIAAVQLGEISDAETAILAAGNRTLAALLDNKHPAKRIARNLFYLSRMIELGAGQEPLLAIAGEIDLARVWWRYGGGRSETGKWERLKILRALGTQILSHPGRTVFRADDLASETVAELLRYDSLREDRRESTVAFRHDVLRDWTIGFLLDEEPERLNDLPMVRPIPGGLSRGIEIAARLAIESDPTGGRWVALLEAVERIGCHGSWTRPVLLALPRSEQALALFECLKQFLLAESGRRLGEIVRLMLAVETEPFGRLIARAHPDVQIPTGAHGIVVPKGISWTWLASWIVIHANEIPSALIPDLSKFFACWLMVTQSRTNAINAGVIELVFDWLTRIEDAMRPLPVRDIRNVKPPDLNFPHMREVRDELRTTFFMCCHLNPSLAERYLKGLDPDWLRHRELTDILRAPGSLTKAAPAALADLTLAGLIEKDDPDDYHGGRRDRHNPFGMDDNAFFPPSPGQGPFLEILQNAPADGLRLVRGLVEHATHWWREQYIEQRRPFPTMSIAFPDGAKSFEGDFSVYLWARGNSLPAIAGSALMALEAWGHAQIEAGRPFHDVMHDVLGPIGSSVAFVCVAVDLALSHWPEAQESAWPLVATPELLQWDDARQNRDAAGVFWRFASEREPSYGRVKRAELDGRLSRRRRLSDSIGDYVFRGPPARLTEIRTRLEGARNRICQGPNQGEDPINGLRGTAERALRMTESAHWRSTKVGLADGSETEDYQYRSDPDEQARLDGARVQALANVQDCNIRAKIRNALFEPETSTPAIVAQSIHWAKSRPRDPEPEPIDDEVDVELDDDFEREWIRRTVVMAAVLGVRDYDGPDRKDVLGWAIPLLYDAAKDSGKRYGGEQIEHNVPAIATLGLAALYEKNQDARALDALRNLAGHQHPAVLDALGRQFRRFNRLDPRLARSIIRIVMVRAAYPRRDEDEALDQEYRAAYRNKVATAIATERRWLEATESEPPWPELPPWLSRRRRGFRIGDRSEDDEEDEEIRIPELYADEHALGTLTNHLIPLTVGDLPEWMLPLSAHLMQWTIEANGPHGDDDGDRDHRPMHWNVHFFDFLGILAVNLAHEQLVTIFLEPITRFEDEPFYDAVGSFLRGFDRATVATDTCNPENPAAVRGLVANRMRRGWGFKRLGREKSFSVETHLLDALLAMFYQPSRWANHGRPHIPQRWNGLVDTMPTLTALVTEASASGYLAYMFLNLVESFACAALMPYVVHPSRQSRPVSLRVPPLTFRLIT
jgi:hypothetical protein